jgi:4-hydroxy-tetrahydrodipicolinate reductase
MSVGVNLLFKLVQMSGEILKNYNVRIEEAHHIHKKDSPSGTAKKIVQLLNEEGFSIKIEDIQAIRKNEIVGDHKIIFESKGDKIEIFHTAKTRDIFAEGALLAAKWIKGKKPGLYSMEDVLSLK